MGRGRAKAKQTKVARDLKYRTIETDFSELQRELHGDDPDAAAMDGTDGGDPNEREYDDSGSATR